MKKVLFVALCFNFLWLSNIFAQDSLSKNKETNSSMLNNTKVMVAGGAQINYVADTGQSQFNNAKFSLMTLAQISQKLFLITELEVETSDNATDIGLEQAQLCYKLAPFMTVYAGRFLPKFGKYRGMLGEGFVNRLAVDPVGWGDGGIGPMVETGVGVVGGFQLGVSKLNYDIYLSNGPQLLTGSPDDPSTAGQFEYEAYLDNNKSKAVGGRIGFLPLPNSSLEIGVSGLKSTKSGDMYSPYEKVGATFYAVDLNYYKYLSFMKSALRVMGEYKAANVDKIDYPVQGDTTAYTFDNNSSAYYAQAALRFSGLKNKFFNKLEIVGRYSMYNTPKDALWGGDPYAQTVVGLNYWFRWDCVLKLDYKMQDHQPNQFVGQVVFRF